MHLRLGWTNNRYDYIAYFKCKTYFKIVDTYRHPYLQQIALSYSCNVSNAIWFLGFAWMRRTPHHPQTYTFKRHAGMRWWLHNSTGIGYDGEQNLYHSYAYPVLKIPRWREEKKTQSALLDFCEGNTYITLNKQSSLRWFGTPWPPGDVIVTHLRLYYSLLRQKKDISRIQTTRTGLSNVSASFTMVWYKSLTAYLHVVP